MALTSVEVSHQYIEHTSLIRLCVNEDFLLSETWSTREMESQQIFNAERFPQTMIYEQLIKLVTMFIISLSFKGPIIYVVITILES